MSASGYLLLLGLFSRLFESSDTLSECEDVSTLFLIDWTNNVKDEEKDQMISLAKHITAGQRDGSEARFNLVADGNTNIDSLDDALDVPSSHTNTVSASAMEAAIGAAFPFTLYPTKAEILYILTTDRTTVDVSSIVLKKKTFVIVFGTSITPSARDIATIGKHVYLIKHNEDIRKVVEELHQQTCIDSHYLCDVDQHKENIRYSTCVNCLDVCSEKRIMAADCTPCPYMRLPPKVQEIKHGPINDVNEPGRYINDNKGNVITSITVSLLMIFVAIGLGLSVYACYRKHVACFGRETEDRGWNFPECNAVHEVGQENISQGALAPNDPLLPPNVSPGNQPDGTDGTGCQGQHYVNIRHCESACGIEETAV